MSGPTYLDLADPAFDVTSTAVHEARERDWYARTPYGWAVLRYEQGTAVLKDRRFQQGNARPRELVGEFAEPYAARVLCLLVGLPDEEWAQVAHWADDGDPGGAR